MGRREGIGLGGSLKLLERNGNGRGFHAEGN